MKAPGESFKIIRHFYSFLHYILNIKCVYFLPLKNIFKFSQKKKKKKKNRFQKITVSRQFSIRKIGKKGERKVQGLSQSQTAALPRPQEEEETDKSKQAQTEQTYEKH